MAMKETTKTLQLFLMLSGCELASETLGPKGKAWAVLLSSWTAPGLPYCVPRGGPGTRSPKRWASG